MDYWIIVDDRHAGPYSARQLVDAGLKADTLVWHEGLPDWVAADQVEELRQAMVERDAEASAGFGESATVAPEPQEIYVQQESTEVYAQPQDAGAYENNEAQTPGNGACATQGAYAAVQLPDEPCPPAYLAVSIIAMLLCCTPLGIVSVIYSSKVKSAYYRGDLAKAKRCSESAQWWIIATIVLGLLWIPFQMAFFSFQ